MQYVVARKKIPCTNIYLITSNAEQIVHNMCFPSGLETRKGKGKGLHWFQVNFKKYETFTRTQYIM